jgi:hypothetical protein
MMVFWYTDTIAYLFFFTENATIFLNTCMGIMYARHTSLLKTLLDIKLINRPVKFMKLFSTITSINVKEMYF